MSEKSVFLTITELAEMLNISKSTISSNVTRKPEQLPPISRIGRTIRFRKSEVESWLTQNTQYN
ncbi:helix-turn-helix domain-containing protein [Yersinia intermedia]|uniref:helix-turn-helix domain-containing protein n=1 Tax=Yersinia intermedia TaxID=631 RepID=UPI0039C67219